MYGTPPEPADNPYAAPPAYGTPPAAPPAYGTPPAAPPAYGGAPSYGTPPAGPAYGASQGPYGAWPTDPYATPPRTSSPQATWSLVLGILGIVLACGCSFVGLAAAVPAILLGNRAKSDAARGLVVANVSAARAGVILGWVGVGLALLRTLGYLASFTQNSM
ncbi:hypothetical protein CBP52_04230 [Cellulomonas sp. PSBB021]|nr:hypothetical protein CBP52_04230 [Cellulomonas sp. PSBB021]